MRGGPDQCRDDIDSCKVDLVHPEHAHNARHDRLNTRDEAADGDRLAAMMADKAFPTRDEARILAERPQGLEAIAIEAAGPVGELVAEHGADRGGKKDRPKLEMPGADQHARADQDRRRRDEKAKNQNGFAKGNEKDERCRPARMVTEIVKIWLQMFHARCALLVSSSRISAG